MLRRGRLRARTLDGRLQVWFESDAGGIPIVNLQGSELVFGLKLTNFAFSHYTKPVLTDSSLVPFYTNRTVTTAVDAPFGVTLTSGIYPHQTQSASRPLTCALKNRDGTVVREEVLRSDDTAVAFDLRQIPDGRYSVVEQTSEGAQIQSELYVNSELRSGSVWGIVSIRIDSSFYTIPPAFELTFQAREEQYKYYLVARNFPVDKFDVLTRDFNVKDSGAGDDHRPEILFDKVASDSFGPSDLPRVTLGDENDLILMFRTRQAIARRARGYQKFVLKQDEKILFDNLPQPAAELPQAQFIVHVSKFEGLKP
jgi:hypothetical protein